MGNDVTEKTQGIFGNSMGKSTRTGVRISWLVVSPGVAWSIWLFAPPPYKIALLKPTPSLSIVLLLTFPPNHITNRFQFSISAVSLLMDSDYGIPRELSAVQKLRSQYQPDLPPCLQVHLRSFSLFFNPVFVVLILILVFLGVVFFYLNFRSGYDWICCVSRNVKVRWKLCD